MHEVNDTTARCLASKRYGTPCERAALPGSPIPVCLHHTAELLTFLNGVTAEAQRSEALTAARHIARQDAITPLQPTGRGVSVVYYVRIGKLIKIGHSSDLRTRIRFYPPDCELMAMEHGGRELEMERLAQFRDHLSMREEWFTPSDELLDHIERLAAMSAAA